MALLNIADVDGEEQPRFWFVIATESVRDVSIYGSKLIRAKSESKGVVRMYSELP